MLTKQQILAQRIQMHSHLKFSERFCVSKDLSIMNCRNFHMRHFRHWLLVPGGVQCHLSPFFSRKTKWIGPRPFRFDRKVTSSALSSHCHVTISHVLSAPGICPTNNYLQTENATDLGYCLMDSLDGVPIKHI